MEKNQTLLAMRRLLPRNILDVTGPNISVYLHASVGNSGVGEARITISERNYQKGGSDLRHEFTIPVRVFWGWKGSSRKANDGTFEYEGSDKAQRYRPCGGYFSLNQREFSSAMHLVSGYAELQLIVNLDGGNNSYLAEHDLHCDFVELIATTWYRGKQIKQNFRIGQSIGPHNSARFGSPGVTGCWEEYRW